MRIGRLRWVLTHDRYVVERGDVTKQSMGTFGPIRATWWLGRATASATIKTPHVTDYVLLIVMALAAPLVVMGYWWHEQALTAAPTVPLVKHPPTRPGSTSVSAPSGQ